MEKAFDVRHLIFLLSFQATAIDRGSLLFMPRLPEDTACFVSNPWFRSACRCPIFLPFSIPGSGSSSGIRFSFRRMSGSPTSMGNLGSFTHPQATEKPSQCGWAPSLRPCGMEESLPNVKSCGSLPFERSLMTPSSHLKNRLVISIFSIRGFLSKSLRRNFIAS